MPSYPERLLPQPFYVYLESFESLADHYVQRRVSTGFWTEVGGEWIADPSKMKLDLQSQHLADASTNLIGTFHPEDSAFQFTKAGKEGYVKLWLPDMGDVVAPVEGRDYTHEPEFESLFLKIGELSQLTIPYTRDGKPGFTAMCRPLHTPIEGNFWHVSLRWFNEEGDIYVQEGRWRRRLLTTARTKLIEFGQPEIDEIEPIDSDLYTK